MKDTNKKIMDSTSLESVDAYKKDLMKTLLKMSVSLLLSTAAISFATIAWFAANTKVDGKTATVVASGPKYEISVLQGNDGNYYDYHSLVRDPSAIVWQMTDTNNMDNSITTSGEESLSTSQGIHPGSYGVISFYVTPKVEEVELSFCFEIIGYTYQEDSNSGSVNMTPIASESALDKYLNGHLLLFAGRQTDSTGKGYIYSNPILSGADMKRVMTQTYTGTDKLYTVDIYWVWPRTLSTLVDATGCETVSVTTSPFTEGDDYSAIVDNITAYPEYYLKDVASEIVSGQSEETAEPSFAEIISKQYHDYGDYADLADNDIGMGVDFILLKLSVEEATPIGG